MSSIGYSENNSDRVATEELCDQGGLLRAFLVG